MASTVPVSCNDSTNRYNSLQLKAEKRFSGSCSLLAPYSMQQAPNNSGSYFNIGKRMDWGPSNAGTIHGLRGGAQMRRFQFALKFEF